jgi:hypothetical protein
MTIILIIIGVLAIAFASIPKDNGMPKRTKTSPPSRKGEGWKPRHLPYKKAW